VRWVTGSVGKQGVGSGEWGVGSGEWGVSHEHSLSIEHFLGEWRRVKRWGALTARCRDRVWVRVAKDWRVRRVDLVWVVRIG